MAWEFVAKGILWRLLSSEEGYIVGEDRELEAKTVSFFCVECESGRVLWQNVQFREKWWIGFDAIHRYVVFFHEYASPDLPGHKKISAVDVRSGNVLWSNEEMEFLFAHDGKVYASKISGERRLFYELELRTGVVVSEVDSQRINALKDTLAPRAESTLFPHPFDAVAERDSSVAQAVHRLTSSARDAVGIEYIESLGNLMIGFYENMGSSVESPLYDQHLAVIDKEKAKVLYKDLVNSRVSAAMPDGFFVRRNFLYYIKDKKILKAIKIHP